MELSAGTASEIKWSVRDERGERKLLPPSVLSHLTNKDENIWLRHLERVNT